MNYFITHVALEWFVFFGAFITEVISPLPSLLVITPAGAIASAQGYGVSYLIILAVIAGVGRLIGAYLLYWLSSQFTVLLFRRRHSYFGLQQADIEKVGDKLTRSWRDWFILVFLNGFPFSPAGIAAIACGFLRIGHGVFSTSVFIGSTLSALFYLYIGYAGLQALTIIEQADLISWLFFVLLVVLVGIGLLARRWRRRRK